MNKWTAATIGGLTAVLLTAGVSASAAQVDEARRILDESGVKGGLIVHVGCGDGRLTAALRANESCLVQGLDGDPANVEKARTFIREKGLYGAVSVEQWDGQTLPYAENMVNLLVISDSWFPVPEAEVVRVLAPMGAAVILDQQSTIRKPQSTIRKPWPKEMDEWTHYAYDATGNNVSHDRLVGPPRSVQWCAEPFWNVDIKLNAMVSARGRIFYVINERHFTEKADRWALIARDAFNGVVLWRRPIANWQVWGIHKKGGPVQAYRKLVAVGDRVYATLGTTNEPVSILDAATGRMIEVLKDTAWTEELVLASGKLLAVVNRLHNVSAQEFRGGFAALERMYELPAYADRKQIIALNAQSGATLWRHEAERYAPLTLVAEGDRVFFHDRSRVVCLDGKTGNERWRSEPVVMGRLTFGESPVLVAQGEEVFFEGNKSVTALAADSGQVLWSVPYVEPRQGGAGSVLADVFLRDGLVWTPNQYELVFEGRNPRTGKVEKKFKGALSVGFAHHRCYRMKATDHYVISSRAGIEFTDLDTGTLVDHAWARGSCTYGIMPANGLLYVPPTDCACFTQAKLMGFWALSAQEAPQADVSGQPQEERIEKGSALPPGGPAAGEDEWPTYRHDAARSGAASVAVPTAGLRPLWRAEIGGQISSPVVAAGKVFVASVDSHTVHAFGVADGRHLWSYTAGGRIDSPPTFCNGAVLFGAADGWVDCLRAEDGALIWRFRGAPAERRIVARGQVESTWPIPGSVLVKDGRAYFVAGRSSYLDGGMRLYALDAATGKVLAMRVLDYRDAATGRQPGITGEDLQAGRQYPGALSDVLSAEGARIFLRHIVMDDHFRDQKPVAHLQSPLGFVNDSWWRRAYWLYGTRFHAMTGAGDDGRAKSEVPCGRILVFDETSVYGYGPNAYPVPGVKNLQLFGASSGTPMLFSASKEVIDQEALVTDAALRERAGLTVPGAKGKTYVTYRWFQPVRIQVWAMVMSKGVIWIAGPTGGKAAEALRGKMETVLCAVSAAEGKELSEYSLEAMPVWDGMAAAGGRLYVSLANGSVVCLGTP